MVKNYVVWREWEIEGISNLGDCSGRDILSKGIAVNAAHGNAKGPALKDIVVGKALNQL